MANTSQSPNMGLTVPTVGQDPGPDWANNINASLGVLDQHNHSTGQGVQITPSGININADLPVNGNNLKSIKTVNFTAQSGSLAGAAPNLGCLYVAGNELYYNDESGNVVAITHTGSVNAGAGSITGLPSGTASASYTAGAQTFVFQSATSTPANLDAGSVVVRNVSSGANGVTVSAPNALSSSYSVVLPPTNSAGATSFVTYDTSNNLGIGPALSSAGLNPAGSMIMFGGVTAPTGYLICDGSAVSRTTYAALFSAIGQNYGQGNGSTTFNIPDFRGMFPRGVDTTGGTNDPDVFSRGASGAGGSTGPAPGSLQGWQIQTHLHHISGGNNGQINGNYVTPAITNIASNAYTDTTGGNQTNPINLYVNFIIKT